MAYTATTCQTCPTSGTTATGPGTGGCSACTPIATSVHSGSASFSNPGTRSPEEEVPKLAADPADPGDHCLPGCFSDPDLHASQLVVPINAQFSARLPDLLSPVTV